MRLQPCDDVLPEVIGCDDAHLGTVRGELVGEHMDVDVRHVDALVRGRRTAAEAQRGLGARVDLEERALTRGELLEPGEGVLAGVLAQRGVERSRGSSVTSPTIRDSRKVRSAAASRSMPKTCQRVSYSTRASGWTRAGARRLPRPA